jgi:hypothetical protein
MPYTIVRIYSDAPGLIDALAERESDVRELITSVPGFLRYGLIRTDSGGFSITSCETKEGCDESSQRAASYLRKNMASMPGTSPTVIEGETVFFFQ